VSPGSPVQPPSLILFHVSKKPYLFSQKIFSISHPWVWLRFYCGTFFLSAYYTNVFLNVFHPQRFSPRFPLPVGYFPLQVSWSPHPDVSTPCSDTEIPTNSFLLLKQIFLDLTCELLSIWVPSSQHMEFPIKNPSAF